MFFNRIKRPKIIKEDMEAVNALKADIELDEFAEKYKRGELPPKLMEYLKRVEEQYGLKITAD